MATDHKVRGGSALSAALCKASPALAKSSPADSATSSDPGAAAASGVAAWLASGGDAAAPAAPAAPRPPQQQDQHLQQHRFKLPFLSCFGAAGAQVAAGCPHVCPHSFVFAVSWLSVLPTRGMCPYPALPHHAACRPRRRVPQQRRGLLAACGVCL